MQARVNDVSGSDLYHLDSGVTLQSRHDMHQNVPEILGTVRAWIIQTAQHACVHQKINGSMCTPSHRHFMDACKLQKASDHGPLVQHKHFPQTGHKQQLSLDQCKQYPT